MLKRALVGASFLWYIAKFPFFALAKVCDYTTNLFNAPIATAIDKLAMRIKHRYGSLMAGAFAGVAHCALQCLFIFVACKLILSAGMSLLILAPSIPVLYLIHHLTMSALVISTFSITAVAFANMMISLAPIFKINNMTINNELEGILPPLAIININRKQVGIVNTNKLKQIRATVLETTLSVVFATIERILMLPVNIINKQMFSPVQPQHTVSPFSSKAVEQNTPHLVNEQLASQQQVQFTKKNAGLIFSDTVPEPLKKDSKEITKTLDYRTTPTL